MNDIIVVMDEGLQKSDPVTSTSKFGSLVQINSIAIDINSSMEVIEPPKHEHFSIRGFVAGMREKNWKTCLPFASEGNDVDLVNNLPPLFVPRFRWWQCSNCIPDDETKRTTGEIEVETTSDAGTDSCQNVGDKIGLFLHSRENTGSKCKTDVRDKEAGNSCDTPEANPLQIIERLNNTKDASDMVCVAERPSCIVDRPDNASSGSDGAVSALPQRRKPKLRSLADIMVKERNSTSDNPRTRSALSCGTQVTSTEMEAVLSPQPELDVPFDAAKDATNPEKKRKIDLGEDGGPLKVIYPSTAAKRIKGLMIDAGKNCSRVEVFDSESEIDASMRLDLGLGARTQRIKPKKAKALNISKKMRLIHKEDKAATMKKFLQINGACSANLQNRAGPEINFGKFGCASSTMEEIGPCFRSSQSGKQIEEICNLSNSKTHEVGDDHDPFVPPRKNNLGNCNIRGKVALDLSLNNFMDAEKNSNDQGQHRVIPDLNEEPLEKTAMTQGQQLNTLPEKSSLPLHKTLDVSFPCSNETSEGKRQLGYSESDNKEQSKELGASDDIPMEIVELLAKNQRERALENTKYLLGIDNSTRGYSALCVDGRPSLIDFPLNRTSGLTVTNGNMGVRQNIPINFPQLNNYRWGMSRTEESLSWSSTRENAPFHLSIAPKHSIQPSGMRVDSFSNWRHKGKTTSDMKDGKEKRAVHDETSVKEGRMGAINKSLGSLDPYSNDTIPAMQLLSLMDERVVMGSSFEVGAKGVLDKSFSPYNHHPHLNEKKNQLNEKKNQNFLSGKFFPQNRHSKNLSDSRYSVYCSGESSKKASSSLRAQLDLELGNSKSTLVATSDSAFGVCTLNRNPADFSIPDARNEFTLGLKDWKFRKRNNSKQKSRMVNIEGGKRRQRTRKDASGKEFSTK